MLALLASVSAARAQATLQGIGDLPGGPYYSGAYGVSGDGRVVVGYAYTGAGDDDFEAVKWTAVNRLSGLGGLSAATPYAALANAVDGCGATIVGASNTDSGLLREAFGWAGIAGMIGISDLPGGTAYSEAYGVSGDGATIVGTGNTSASNNGPAEAFKWTLDGGMQGLGFLPGGSVSFAARCAHHGEVIVGAARTAANHWQACRWTSTGIAALPYLPGGGLYGAAVDCSGDGSIIAGQSDSSNGTYEGFRWSAGGGMVGLGDLPGGIFSSLPQAMSADGSVIVGGANFDPNSFTGDAFIWDAAHGMRELKAVLAAAGANVAGWTLLIAWDVSDDGRTIVGEGINPDGAYEGWVARLPDNCPGDDTGDGVIDVNDLLSVIAHWGACP